MNRDQHTTARPGASADQVVAEEPRTYTILSEMSLFVDWPTTPAAKPTGVVAAVLVAER